MSGNDEGVVNDREAHGVEVRVRETGAELPVAGDGEDPLVRSQEKPVAGGVFDDAVHVRERQFGVGLPRQWRGGGTARESENGSADECEEEERPVR